MRVNYILLRDKLLWLTAVEAFAGVFRILGDLPSKSMAFGLCTAILFDSLIRKSWSPGLLLIRFMRAAPKKTQYTNR